MQTRIKIGAEAVTFDCAPELHQQASWLAGILRNIASERGAIFFQPGRTIQLGWSRLTLVREGGELQVHEPDFDTDPFTHTRNRLTVTLTVLAQQNDWLHRLQVDPVAFHYSDKFYVSHGTREVSNVFLQRMPAGETETNPPWAMKLLADPKRESDWEWVFVFSLLRFRPWYLPFLALPVGFLVVFQDDEVDAVIDPANRVVFAR